MAQKRKTSGDLDLQPGKRIKITPTVALRTNTAGNPSETVPLIAPPVVIQDLELQQEKPGLKRKKLLPPRPFPTVPTSAAATVPYSARSEGKNFICITRKTDLGAYMRRCKDVILKDGYKTLHFSAMGAAIPMLVQLSVALPPILPYHSSEIATEISTGTCDVHDELIPEDDSQEPTMETRSKSTLTMILKIGDGIREPAADNRGSRRKRRNNVPPRKPSEGSKNKQTKEADQTLFQEPEQEMEE